MTLDRLIKRIVARDFTIGIIGLGYVGLPLAVTALGKDFKVIGFDVDQARVDKINKGETVIAHIPGDQFVGAIAEGRFEATTDMSRLSEPDAILIAVPTPLDRRKDPDLTYVESATKSIATALRKDQLVVLESTTWPGTTRKKLLPLLQAGGLKVGEGFYLAFSPEREDPGNKEFSSANTPKVVGADDPNSLKFAKSLYSTLAESAVPVSSSDTAEAVKLTENIFRAVNIALVNELKMVFEKMNINVWEVIEAASSKPFGYTAFYPGPGLGGHCIPIDPSYLTWRAKDFNASTPFIDLASNINAAMPDYVVERLTHALNEHASRGVNGAKILLIGMAYKKNVDDMRESPAIKLTLLLEARGCAVEYHDPHIPEIRATPDHPEFAARKSVDLTPDALASYDVILIATDHDDVDWAQVVEHGRLIVDTRNACAEQPQDKVVRA